MTIKMDKKPLKELEKDLKIFARRSLPYAARDAINKTGWEARKKAQNKISAEFTERNRWTRGSVLVAPTRTLRIDQMSVEVGSVEDYMETQEMGGTKRSRTGQSVAVPTGYAAGQEGSEPRTRLPRRPNRVRNIQLTRYRIRGGSPKQRLLAAVNMAVRERKRFLYLERSKHGVKNGMYRVVGGRYRGSGWPRGAKLKMVASLDKASVRIPKSPWLRPSADSAMRSLPHHYARALIFQFRRQRIFQNK